MRRLVDSPVLLALLRIAVPLVILISPELHDAVRLASDPAHLRYPPEGLRTLAAVLTITPSIARALQVVAFSSAATAILGFKARASMLVLTLSAGLLFSLSQRSGAVLHDMHLFWMTALLAASPCGDAWSLDAWGLPRPAPSMRYGVPLAFARLFLGVVYFFPGLHKVAVSGLRWMTADNVLGHMQAKWLEHGAVPSIRIDEHPWLCAVGAVLVVGLELSFGALALAGPRARLGALAGGALFHASTQLFFFIPFTALWACYVALLPTRWVDRAPPDLDARPARLPIAVGSVVALFAIVQGARAQTQAWPFACYPTFSHVQPHEIPDLLVEVTTTDEAVRRLTGREHALRSQADWGRVFRISGAYGDAPNVAALREHARAVMESAVPPIAPGAASQVRVLRVLVATAPSRWGETPPVDRGVVLTEWRETTR
ncbi:MAG: HTTM domain-containing protein [Deltaproteobacteria bacterium]|nr:HTTM domain-containing protein [Deltaproteobacteria bacterium]